MSDHLAGESVPATERRDRWRRWRLSAPVGFRWTDDDVLSEKTQSFLNGVIAGACGYTAILILAVAVFR